MRKLLFIYALLIFLLAGCSASNIDVSLKTTPKYNGETSYPFVIEASNEGQPAGGLSLTVSFEMAKMDHGTMEVQLEDIGNGLYESSIELPMAGEWIATITGESEGKSIEKVITLDVEED